MGADDMGELIKASLLEASTGNSIVDNAQQNLTPSIVGVQDIEKAEPAAHSTITDWDGPDDPDNPLNWLPLKRHFHVLPPAFIAFTCSIGSSIYAPAVTSIMESWHVSSTVALLPLTLYVVALGCGPILAAPISETYGRRIVYLASIPIAALFTLGAGLSTNIWTLCILRFFSGLTFSPALAVGPGSVADINTPAKRALHSALFVLCPFLGPSLGPVIGSFVTVRKSWRWTQWTLIFLSIFSFLLTLLTHETYKKTILERRAIKRGTTPPSTAAMPTAAAKLKFLITVTLLRPIHMLTTEPIVFFGSLYVSFNFSVLFAFFAAFPYVFESVYHFDTEQSGLVFLAIGIGCCLAVPTFLLCDRFFYQPHVRSSLAKGGKGVVAPEHRLYPAMVGSFGLPLGLFWFAWTARADISWASPVVAAIPFAWGNLSVFIAVSSYFMDTYQALNSASAMAANGLLRYALGGVFPLFTLQMYGNLGIGWATSLLAFVAVAMLPVPWVLFRYGKQIRKRSAYDTIHV